MTCDNLSICEDVFLENSCFLKRLLSETSLDIPMWILINKLSIGFQIWTHTCVDIAKQHQLCYGRIFVLVVISLLDGHLHTKMLTYSVNPKSLQITICKKIAISFKVIMSCNNYIISLNYLIMVHCDHANVPSSAFCY